MRDGFRARGGQRKEFDVEKLRRLWNMEPQLTTVEIGNRLGMSRQLVARNAARLGLAPRPPRKRLIEDDDFRVRWLAGERVGDIAKAFGCTCPAVSKRAVALGLPQRWTKATVAAMERERQHAAQVERNTARRREAIRERIESDAVPLAPAWRPEVDRAILDAGRSYAALREVEDRFELPAGRAWRRWAHLNGASMS